MLDCSMLLSFTMRCYAMASDFVSLRCTMWYLGMLCHGFIYSTFLFYATSCHVLRNGKVWYGFRIILFTTILRWIVLCYLSYAYESYIFFSVQITSLLLCYVTCAMSCYAMGCYATISVQYSALLCYATSCIVILYHAIARWLHKQHAKNTRAVSWERVMKSSMFPPNDLPLTFLFSGVTTRTFSNPELSCKRSHRIWHRM